MKSNREIMLVFLLVISLIGTFPIVADADGEGWLDGWDNRMSITITPKYGHSAGTDYQIFLNVTYEFAMQSDFDDLRFTDNDGETELDYWIEEYIASTFAIVWVEVNDSLDTAKDIYMYYGNVGCSTTSNGKNTFPVLYEDWTTQSVQGAVWTTLIDQGSISWSPTDANHEYVAKIQGGVGTDRQYYNSVASGEDPTALIFRAKLEKTVAADQYVRIGATSSSIHGMAVVESIGGTQQFSVYDDESNGDDQVMDDAHFDSYHSFCITRNGTATNLYIDNVLDETGSWDPDAVDQVYATMQVRDEEYDLYVDWIAVREFVSVEPVAVFNYEYKWNLNGVARVYFSVPFDMWGMDTALIILGFVMIPVGTLYLAYGIKNDRSSDRLFYGLIIIFLGFGLFIGGILP